MKKKIWNIGIKLKISIGFAFILIVLIGIQYALNKSITNVIASQQELLVSTKLSTEIEAIKSSVSQSRQRVSTKEPWRRSKSGSGNPAPTQSSIIRWVPEPAFSIYRARYNDSAMSGLAGTEG